MTQNVSETEPFEVREPEKQRIPFVFNSPHSGRVYPEAFLSQSRLDVLSIRRSEDRSKPVNLQQQQNYHAETPLPAPQSSA